MRGGLEIPLESLQCFMRMNDIMRRCVCTETGIPIPLEFRSTEEQSDGRRSPR